MEANYFDIHAVSSSSLKSLCADQGGTPKRFKMYMEGEAKRKVTPYLALGSSVHKWMEDKSSFSIADFDKPSDTVCEIVESLYREGLPLAVPPIIDEMDRKKYYAKMVDVSKRADKVIIPGQEYYNWLKSSEGKVVMSAAERDKFNGIQESVMNNRRVASILEDDSLKREF
ncbi:MAG: hypothetical protein ACXABY_06460, partial [Candidatus Thorarchaeota archaeon]